LGKGAKYDINKLKDGKFVKELKNNFEKIKRALVSTLEFVKSDAKILAKRFLKSDLSLIPIIDFIYRQPHQILPEGQTWKLIQYLYMSFLMKFYSYGPDGKLDILHKKISEYKDSDKFPIENISEYIEERTGIIYKISNNMLYNLDIILNIIYGGISEIPNRRGWSLEKDHIFPRSILKNTGVSDELINNIGNFRYINKTRNIIKSDNLPEEDLEYFGSNNEDLKKLFKKAINNLNEKNYKNFIELHEKVIISEVKNFLNFDKK
jgi:hypothetical protein